MGRWRERFHSLIYRAEKYVDRKKNEIKRPFLRDELMVFPYLGYGTTKELYVKGRVLEDKGIADAADDASLLRNLIDSYKRFDSDETPNAKVRVRFQKQQEDVTTDPEGYFEVRLNLETPLDNPDYFQELSFELLQPHPAKQEDFFTTGTVIVPSEKASFGIISDMDDTVLQTGATSIVSMAKKTLFGNSRTRLPFEGVAAFYTALHRDLNPLFYVSSSPWNLYDLLIDFLDVNDIPVGPLMLRDWGIKEDELLPTSHGTHKLDSITDIFETYPKLPFILIGDSGEEDPEIYSDIVERFPERILGIFIRDVVLTDERSRAIANLAQKVKRDKSELFLVKDTIEAARQAAEKGWIEPYSIKEIEKSKADDLKQPIL